MQKIIRIILSIACIGVLAFAPTFAYKKTSLGQTFPNNTPTYKQILTLWHLDLFEGGVGSRSDFLSKVSLLFEEKGILVMVLNQTEESAKSSIEKGIVPDIVSFSGGADFFLPYLKSLENINFKGGTLSGKTYAYPWCRGGYFLITKTEDNQPIDTLFVSQNKYNLPFGAINSGNIKAENLVFEEPQKAYEKFLSSSEGALLGTQRDIWRLKRRNEQFYSKPLEEFSDLVQYVGITTLNEEKVEACKKFLSFLSSDEVQNRLTEIGMFPINFNPYNENLGEYDLKKTAFTVSPFIAVDLVESIKEEVNRQKITNDGLLRFKNTLKHL